MAESGKLRALVRWREEQQARVDAGVDYPPEVRAETYLEHTGLLLKEIAKLRRQLTSRIMSASQLRAVNEILAERNRQDGKWGPQREHEPLYWLGILVEEVGEVAKATIEMIDADEIHDELVEVAAVAICWLEAME